MKKENNSSAAQNLLFYIKMLLFLMESPRTVPECVEYSGKSKRTIERILKTFKDAGFEVIKTTPEKGTVETHYRMYHISVPSQIQENAQKVASETTDKIESEKEGDLERILGSPFFSNKPFIEALWGEWTGTKSARFTNKVKRYQGARFTDEERAALKGVLANISSVLDSYLY
jgi:predicted transcriptional regulator